MPLDLIYKGDHLAQDFSYLVSAPIGAIMIWSGTENNVPEGWSICNGQNGTIDLRDKFVLAAGESHPVGETGGSEEVTLTVAQMPKHSHQIETFIYDSGSGTVKIKRAVQPDGTATTSINAMSVAGSSQPHPNMPPYYTLLYIQKTGVTPSDYATVEQVEEIVEEKLGDSSTEEVYSTQETKIGTWIDGKPLYRKIFIITLPSESSKSWTYYDTIENFDAAYSIKSVGYNSGFGGYMALPNYECSIGVKGNGRIAAMITLSSSGFINGTAIFTVEYTKTTD